MSERYKPLFSAGFEMAEKAMKSATHRVAYDIGSHDGQFSRVIADLGFEVFAFEPLTPLWMQAFEKNASRPSIHTFNIGVSDSECEAEVAVYNCWTLAPDGAAAEKSRELGGNHLQHVKFRTLDDVVGEIGKCPGFIKIDVDGYEGRVIRGGWDTFSKYKPHVLLELSALAKIIGDDPAEPLIELYRLGYRAHSMDGSYCAENFADAMKCFPWDSSYDVVMVHRDLKYD